MTETGHREFPPLGPTGQFSGGRFGHPASPTSGWSELGGPGSPWQYTPSDTTAPSAAEPTEDPFARFTVGSRSTPEPSGAYGLDQLIPRHRNPLSDSMFGDIDPIPSRPTTYAPAYDLGRPTQPGGAEPITAPIPVLDYRRYPNPPAPIHPVQQARPLPDVSPRHYQPTAPSTQTWQPSQPIQGYSAARRVQPPPSRDSCSAGSAVAADWLPSALVAVLVMLVGCAGLVLTQFEPSSSAAASSFAAAALPNPAQVPTSPAPQAPAAAAPPEQRTPTATRHLSKSPSTSRPANSEPTRTATPTRHRAAHSPARPANNDQPTARPTAAEHRDSSTHHRESKDHRRDHRHRSGEHSSSSADDSQSDDDTDSDESDMPSRLVRELLGLG